MGGALCLLVLPRSSFVKFTFLLLLGRGLPAAVVCLSLWAWFPSVFAEMAGLFNSTGVLARSSIFLSPTYTSDSLLVSVFFALSRPATSLWTLGSSSASFDVPSSFLPSSTSSTSTASFMTSRAGSELPLTCAVSSGRADGSGCPSGISLLFKSTWNSPRTTCSHMVSVAIDRSSWSFSINSSSVNMKCCCCLRAWRYMLACILMSCLLSSSANDLIFDSRSEESDAKSGKTFTLVVSTIRVFLMFMYSSEELNDISFCAKAVYHCTVCCAKSSFIWHL
mmetsp:Transcript_4566/g.28945  ORF Transcript_4566/g.28945 Transcript_4566/m.28945 type:complete len:279 (-) Transcript_4566:3183-4019(-)